MKDLISKLRGNTLEITAAAEQAADLLERIYSQPVELPEHRGWQWLDTANFRKQLPDGAEPAAWNKLYTADQLTQAVQEATARALEAAARECEALGKKSIDYYNSASFAHAIRNLIGGVK